MGALERRIERVEDKIDAMDQEFDKLLMALASRGVVLPVKTGSEVSGEK